ncbi:MAG TPA: site-2 protease family protein [Syntrophomonadaceae bacterium]|nr:site-2 protease family protein [Syntrophomonadaceae bacterium]
MRGSFVIGRIRGIDIEINFSWLLIFALMTYMLATSYFPLNYPDWGPALWWLLGASAALLLFASVLLHELCHSLVSVSLGLPVKRITLFIFGGVAQIEGEPDEPMKELKIALAGPAMSIVLGIVFLLLAGVLAAAGTPQYVSVLFGYLGTINLMLAVFNLVPAFPLDGGRVLRAILWHFKGDMQGATRIAASAGGAFGYTLIFLGIFLVLAGNLANGIWMAFIGWFIAQAAQSSYQQMLLSDIFTKIPVRDFMTTQVVIVDYFISVQDLVDKYFYKHKYAFFPVRQQDQITGIVSLNNVRNLPQADWPRTTVGRIVTPLQENLIVRPDEAVAAVMNKLFANGVGRVLVMEGSQLLGLVSRTDVLNYMRIHGQLSQK